MSDWPKEISFREPTLDQHRSASAQWLSRVGPCFYENWPEDLKAISFETTLVELNRDDQSVILDAFDNVEPEKAADLFSKLRVAADRFPNGFFPRLSSRSAKDAWVDTLRCQTPEDILVQFSSSERILDDLIEYKYTDVPCFMLLREWCDIPKPEEWRCFLREGRLAGISQYHYGEAFHYEDVERIQHRLRCFLDAEIVPHLHMDTVVVDVWLRENDWPLLIEINPYGLSDPCLLTYEEMAGEEQHMRLVQPPSTFGVTERRG